MRRAFASLLLLLPLLACTGRPAHSGESPAERDSPDPEVQVTVELTSRLLQGGDDGGGRVTAAGTAGGVQVQGSLSTPNPCYRLTGSVRRDDQIVTLTVEGRDSGGICVQSIGAFAYEASVRGLPAGTYTFRVIYTYPDTGWETRPALDTTVTVR